MTEFEDFNQGELIERPSYKPYKSPRTILNEGLWAVQDAFEEIPKPIWHHTIAQLSNGLDETTGLEKAKLLKALFTTSEASNLVKELYKVNIRATQIPDLIGGPEMQPLISTMLDQKEHFIWPLGVIFSQVQISQFPDEIHDKFKPLEYDKNVTLSTPVYDRFLCIGAEMKLDQSITDKSAMVLTDTFDKPLIIAKLKGKCCGVCLTDFTTAEGLAFIRGSWYAPIDQNSISYLHSSFLEKRGRVELQSGIWVHSRSYQPQEDDKLIEDLLYLDQDAAEIPPIYTNKKIRDNEKLRKRRKYLSKNQEAF